MKRFSLKTKVAAAGLAIGLVGGAGIAYAAWSASGTGNGAAQAITANAITVNAGTAVADLYPGGPAGAVKLVVSNPNPYAVTLTGASYGTPVSLNTGACASSNIAVDASAPTTVNVALAANATNVAVSIPGVLDLDHGAGNGCQGVGFTVPVTLSGSQN